MRASYGIGTVLSAGNMPMVKTDGTYILVGDRRKNRRKGKRRRGRKGGREKSQTKCHRFRKNGLVSNMNFNKELR